MEDLPLALYLATLISVLSAVVSVWSNRKKGVAELSADVEELALLVERLGKAQRREKMARVRATTTETFVAPAGSQEIQGHLPIPPTDTRAVKAAIRAKLRGVPS